MIAATSFATRRKPSESAGSLGVDASTHHQGAAGRFSEKGSGESACRFGLVILILVEEGKFVVGMPRFAPARGRYL
ncbi:hypothetical protein [Novosphingobium pentaromativorans]|uniref:Uncharacterized protein n=1 Tax=Novosphingobium pentaromativorans US6-1 TaxID=1088721 RepID=G6EHA3_9SPHN|nr:hypothetical protein [Novosphingobium pentaromativorans]EHJ59392.1 hypothetical protein NSU_3724 [Novosphingobium pentaromativorans US6-1]